MKTFTAMVVAVCLFVLTEAFVLPDIPHLEDECKSDFYKKPFFTPIRWGFSKNVLNFAKFILFFFESVCKF